MGTVPFSNPAGNNQMSPSTKMGGVGAPSPIATGNIPGAPGAVNPMLPVAGVRAMNTPLPGGTVPSNPSAPTIPNVGGLTTSGSNVAGDTGAVDKQLTDIAGKGVGGALASLLSGMSGTDSQILQEYIASLGPQMATAQANVNANLGASGVSANSSVTGLADANLQSQEFGAIASESANLTQSQEQMTSQILMGLTPAATKETSSSGWSVFGDVMNGIAGDVGDIVGAGKALGIGSQAQNAGLSSPGYSAGMGADTIDSGTLPTDPSIASEAMLPFGV